MLSGYYYQYVVRDKDQAVAAYSKAIDLLPEATNSYLARAYLYLDLGEYDSAQADFETSLTLDDQSSEARYGLASVASTFEDLDLERDYLEQAVAVSNNGLGERLDLAWHLLLNNEPDSAWQLVNEVLAEDPSSAGAYAIRAVMHQFEQDNRHALTDANKALDINPQFVFALFVRAETLLANEQYDDVVETAEQILAYEPEAYDAHRLLFYAAYRLEDLAEAERQYDLWLNVKPDFVDEYQTQGDMEMTLGRYEDAAATFSAGLADDETPELAEWLLYSRAYAYLSLEDDANYQADFEQLLGSATIIDLISDAEYWLAADKGLLVAVDGLATYTDESLGFQISYPSEWQRPLLSAEENYDFLVFQEFPDGFAVVNLVTITGAFGLTLDDIVPIVSDNVGQTEGLTLLQTQYGEIGGIRAFVMDYELVLQDGLGNDEIYRGRQYVVLKNSVVWFFTVETSPADFEPNLPLIEEIMASIQFLQ
jgi:tetratricopeptide (TPR) repeat protein